MDKKPVGGLKTLGSTLLASWWSRDSGIPGGRPCQWAHFIASPEARRGGESPRYGPVQGCTGVLGGISRLYDT
jgi:hypothetical protein